jgi:enoyl-CoA hydratase/carnithine racemase
MPRPEIRNEVVDLAPVLVDRITSHGADIAIVTLNRPHVRNPIDKVTIRELRTLIAELSEPGGPRAIVLTGAGDTFSAGGDLKGYQSLYRDPAEFRRFMDDFDATCDLIESSPACVIAMINGTCVAGGLELALACDAIVVADEARIGDGHLRFAQLPGAGGSQRLVRAIGVQRARHWLLTGNLFDAHTAVESGLAVSRAPRPNLLEHTLKFIADITERSPLAFARMKALINIAQNHGLAEGLGLETDVVHEYATTSHDAPEGLDAFAERRAPRYLGR